MARDRFSAMSGVTIFATFALVAHLVNSQDTISLSCRDGWMLHGTDCYKLFKEEMEWHDASRICRRYGSELVSIFGFQENKAAAEFVQSQGVPNFWIGELSGQKRGVEGFWGEAEPKMGRDCAYVSVQPTEYYIYTWYKARCNSAMPFLCEAKAVLDGMFPCLNGNFIKPADVCDGKDGCGDMSDELDCPGHCRKYIRKEEGTISTDNPYDLSMECWWVIESSVGTRLMIDFSSVRTEERVDEIQLWVGGPTPATSMLIAQISGTKNSNDLPRYYSNNNFMIILFRSDASVAFAGFTASYHTEDILPGNGELLMASSEQVGYIESPMYPDRVVSAQRKTWHIYVPTPRRVISIQFDDFNTGGGAYLEIYDGDSLEAPSLGRLVGNNDGGPQVIISTTNNMTVYFHTGYTDYPGRGFRLSYRVGCMGSIRSNYGEVISPGYNADLQYPNFQDCYWTVESETNVGMKMIIVDEFGLDGDLGDDILKIYEGSDDTGNLIAMQAGSGDISPSSFVANSGKFFIHLHTTSVNSETGFKIRFSENCQNPSFPANTIVTPADFTTELGSRVTVRCDTGYFFSQQQNVNKVLIEMECIPGNWNVNSLPICEPMYCGQPPEVDNAHIIESTGVRFTDTVKYECDAGFSVIGLSDVITCDSGGHWSPKPACQSATCPFRSAPQFGTVEILYGEGTNYGTELNFDCIDGYYIVGSPIIICQGDGTWSDASPLCQKLHCALPDITNAASILPADVLFQQTASVVCQIGFRLEGSATMRCEDDQQFDQVPTCVDIDECQGTRGPCEHLCDNTIGSFICSCNDGYELVTDTQCQDIIECNDENAGCSHTCTTAGGTYTCSCPAGYSLFITNGDEGFFIATGETGERRGDVFHKEHTCVPKRCPDLNPLVNGHILNTQDLFHFEDEVFFFCDLGYLPSHASSAMCQSNAQWNRAQPTCDLAKCAIPTTFGMQYPPSFSPSSGMIDYGSTMTVTCTQHRPVPLVYERVCVYNQQLNTYTVKLEDSFNCPIIDCGVPDLSVVPASIYQTGLAPSNTKFSDSFLINCGSQSQVLQETGNSEGDRVVVCRQDSNWDFGAFRCLSKQCNDPGTPAGATQNTDGSYQEGQTVTFTCDRDGFTLTDDTPLKCILIGNDPRWDRNLPQCVDTTDPRIIQNQELCTKDKIIGKLTAPSNNGAGMDKPVSDDNTGATSSLVETVTPRYFDPSVIINQPALVTYTFTDFAGNSQQCEINILIKDDVFPTLACPESYTIYINSDTATTTFDFPETAHAATAQDNIDGTLTPTYTPSQLILGSTDVGKQYRIAVVATDSSGNVVECSFMVDVRAGACQPWALKQPLGGTKSCLRNSNNNGYDCTVACDTGKYFYDNPDQSSLTYTCTDGNSFTPSGLVPDCVDVEFSEYRTVLTFKFSHTTAMNPTNCVDYYRTTISQLLPDAATYYRDICRVLIIGTNSELVDVETVVNSDYPSLTFNSQAKEVTAKVAFSLYPRNMSSSTLESSCGTVIVAGFAGGGGFKIANLQTISSFDGCPELTAMRNTAQTDTANNGRVCSEGHKKFKVANSEDVCLPCPYGRYYTVGTDDNDPNFCQPCGLGEYSDVIPTKTCKQCGGNTWTRQLSSPSVDYCEDTCSVAGMISATKLAPCRECPAGQYAADDTTCRSCPAGKSTLGPGAASEADCFDRCPAGFYSDSGLSPCQACPLHFYQSGQGSNNCLQCVDNRITNQMGSTTSADCVDGASVLCTTNICNNGACSVGNHQVQCTCTAGWMGNRCNIQINYCESNPCYAGSCTPLVNGYQCTCPSNDYSGDRCEVFPDHCQGNACQNGGQCQNKETFYNCLCPENYDGAFCQIAADICSVKPCTNGNCVQVNPTRRRCECNPGFTGRDCADNIDECLSNPCLYGAECVDDNNAFRCVCPTGYSGPRCELRPDICVLNPCSTTGLCIDDYRDNEYMCLCATGYRADTTYAVANLFWMMAIDTLTVDDRCPVNDYCGTDPCDSGSCSYSIEGAVCNCPSGITGKLCQHNVDDCGNDPCTHGTCVDQVGTFTCNCDSGYEGPRCDTEVIECNPYPCDSQGTDSGQGAYSGCDDLVNDYKCHCKSGYVGKDCSVDVNECASAPCMHGGTCDDQINGYLCTCVDGWMGQRCDQIVDNCVGDPCQNEAECRNIFNDYSCQCSFSHHGKNCDEESNMCDNPDPCVDPNAICFVNDQMKAECDCSIDYMGEGCHISVDYCSRQGMCQHGGTCIPKLNGFQCRCKSDFEGEFCEQSVNNCVGRVCSNGGTCVDGVEEHFCDCPIGKTGPTCNKDVDDDFDIFFESESKTSSANTAFPFNLDLDEISVGLWVRYSDKMGTGTFFTLFGLDERYADAPGREILRFDHEKVYATFGFIQEARRFTLYDINDGQWYYINCQWSGLTGTFVVTVNSVKVIELTNHGMGWRTPPFGMIILGSEIDSRLDPVPDSGFKGYISGVNVWDLVLGFINDIPPMVDDSKNLVHPGLIRRWSDYFAKFGAYVQRPSDANKAVCENPRYGGVNCNILLPDKEKPVIDDCPETIWVHNIERLTQVTWDDPVVEGNDGGLRSTYLNERVFIWGRYTNVYAAYDNSGNAAMCSFDIFVRKQNCPEPTADPLGGTVDCTLDLWPFRSCSATCNSNSAFSLPVPDFYTCGPQGSFNAHNFNLDFQYPACAPSVPARVDVRVYITYPQIQACEEVIKVDGFGIPIRNHITELDLLWGIQQNLFNGFCLGQDCNVVVVVNTQCGGATTVGRKRRSTSDAFVEIIIENIQEILYNSDGVGQTPAEILLHDILDLLNFNLDSTIGGAIPDEPSLRIVTTPICQEGQTLSGDGLSCVDCAAGTKYDASTKSCVACPVGSYQDQTGSSTCKECGQDKTTEFEGMKSSADCYDLCKTGSYLNKQAGACLWCEIGFYQDQAGQFYCKPCDADKTTHQIASTSVVQCFDICEDGTELGDQDGTCRVCPRGTYRTQGVQVRCTQCPANFITPAEKSRTESQCTDPDCQPGSYHDVTNSVCEPCPIGTYQPTKWQTSCIPCADRKTTLDVASTSENMCLFFCPIGLEEYPTGSSTCRLCPVGTYKDNAEPGDECITCEEGGKAGFVTDGQGASTVNNCTILACTSGEQPNDNEDGCEPCPHGTFQPQPFQSACRLCPPDTWTRDEGATMSSQCEDYCPDGQDENAFGQCVDCLIGTYRNNDNDRFGECESCSAEFITADEGSENINDCVVRNCTAGYKLIEVQNLCEPCPIGEYQDEWWQTECKECPPQKTTEQTASDSVDDCLLHCSPGNEDRNDVCEPCNIGYYKSTAGSTRCVKCPEGFITEGLGATSSGQCNIGDCQPGSYRSDVDDMCYDCDIGFYQDDKWQFECDQCPMGSNLRRETTFTTGADSEGDCILMCASGYEYDTILARCVLCMRGTYRAMNAQGFCELCPIGYITESAGSSISSECTVANCTAGEYRRVEDETCQLCPVGDYQPNKWQDSCLHCPIGMTTLAQGAESVDECRRSCPSGQELVEATNQCRLCPQNMFRDVQQSYTCVQCPPNTIAPREGATSVQECTWPDCDAGHYIRTSECLPCPDGTYQPSRWSTQCNLCPQGNSATTGGTGATAVSWCQSSDDCLINPNLCSGDGQMCVDLPGLDNYECQCAREYTSQGPTGNFPPCIHKCDSGYCLNDATCVRNSVSGDVCICRENWSGPRCDVWEEPPSMTKYIIGGAIGGFVFLLLFILLIVFLCVCLRPKPATPMPMPMKTAAAPMIMPIQNPSYDIVPQQTVFAHPAPSVQYQPTAATTIIATDRQSLPGYSTLGNQNYLYYEDREETVPQPQQLQYGTLNSGYNPYEEKVSAINIS